LSVTKSFRQSEIFSLDLSFPQTDEKSASHTAGESTDIVRGVPADANLHWTATFASALPV
jgi:hypothetical protein